MKDFLLFILLKPEKLTCIQYDSIQSHNHITGCSIIYSKTIFIIFFAFDFCRFCMVIRVFHPATTSNDLPLQRIFYPRFYPLHLFSYLNSWERASIFPFKCSVPNKGTTGTILKTSLVWRGPWLGIEPGTSCTQCQHSTTRLSRRWYF